MEALVQTSRTSTMQESRADMDAFRESGSIISDATARKYASLNASASTPNLTALANNRRFDLDALREEIDAERDILIDVRNAMNAWIDVVERTTTI